MSCLFSCRKMVYVPALNILVFQATLFKALKYVNFTKPFQRTFRTKRSVKEKLNAKVRKQ